MKPIADLWNNGTEQEWRDALDRYWQLVSPKIRPIEEDLTPPIIGLIEGLGREDWFDFLYSKYFVWKYTAPNRLAMTRQHLRKYRDNDKLDELLQIRDDLLHLDPSDPAEGLAIARQIHGLGTAGASGLLSLMYPGEFGTVDQFIVYALRGVPDLPERRALDKMNGENLTVADGAILTRLLRAKAAANNRKFNSTEWTPRAIDQVLWNYGR